ncbi:MAG TPA: hypothetical protein VIT65_28030 [Microlunatus sp.]
MTTPVREEQPPPPPEELMLGPRQRRELPRWVPLVALILGGLILAGGALWRFWPRPIEPISLVELQNTYAGMVRGDGTNEASVMTRQLVKETPLTVLPDRCAPLVEATAANRFPDAALDGVGTYWALRNSAISLFTFRFDDAEQAEAERERINAALDACVDQQIVVRPAQATNSKAWQAMVRRTEAGSGGDGQLGYTLAGPDGLMAIQLMPYLNTISWQSRYETGSGSYSTLSADQLMQSLRSQVESIVAARPS